MLIAFLMSFSIDISSMFTSICPWAFLRGLDIDAAALQVIVAIDNPITKLYLYCMKYMVLPNLSVAFMTTRGRLVMLHVSLFRKAVRVACAT